MITTKEALESIWCPYKSRKGENKYIEKAT